MVGRRLKRFVTGGLLAAAALLSTTCQPGDLALRTYYQNLTVREILIPIKWGTVSPVQTGFMMGDFSFRGTFIWPPASPLPGGDVLETTQTISYKFNISKYEITNELYAQFMADGGYSKSEYWTKNGWAEKESGVWTEPIKWQDSNFNLPTQPVAVSWYEAVAYCNWRSVIEGLNPAYDAAGKADLKASGYRLPTEVEWEYTAARAGGGGETVFPWVGTWVSGNSVCSVNPTTFLQLIPALTKTAVVGSIPAGNSRGGASDMAGNVQEWCSDNFQADASVVDGADRYYFVDDTNTNLFVSRGGTYSNPTPDYFRCAYRIGRRPFIRGSAQGFRIMQR
jgi:formylglycine-generating enzyme required for sulfatase activity